MADGCRNLFVLWLPKTSLISEFSCLLSLQPTNLESPASSFNLFLPSAYRAGFRFHLGCSQGSKATKSSAGGLGQAGISGDGKKWMDLREMKKNW